MAIYIWWVKRDVSGEMTYTCMVGKDEDKVNDARRWTMTLFLRSRSALVQEPKYQRRNSETYEFLQNFIWSGRGCYVDFGREESCFQAILYPRCVLNIAVRLLQ